MFGIHIKSVPDCSTCLEMEYRAGYIQICVTSSYSKQYVIKLRTISYWHLPINDDVIGNLVQRAPLCTSYVC